MSAGGGVRQLCAHSNAGSRAAQAALDQEARAQLAAELANVGRVPRQPRRRAGGDDVEVRKARQAGRNVLGETVGQRLEVGVAAPRAQRQDGDPRRFRRHLLRGRAPRCIPRRVRRTRCGFRGFPLQGLELVVEVAGGLVAVGR